MNGHKSLVAFMFAAALATALPARAEAPLVWPAPPAPARIQYLKSIATVEDVAGPKGFFSRLWEFVVGPEQMQMRKPMGVAVDGKGGWLAVTDPSDKRVHLFHEARGEYWTLSEADKSAFQHPIAVAADGRGNLYVVDSEQRQVHLFEGARRWRRSYGGPETLQRPTGVAVDAARGRLYVVDTPAHAVRVFDLDGGAPVNAIGGRGMLEGEFNYPSFITVDRSGQIYVTDALNGRIQAFDPDGAFVRSIGQRGDGSGDFSAPKGIALDSAGHVYVADADFDTIQIFDAQSRLLLFFGRSGQEPGMFWMPAGLAMGEDDRLYVADSYNKRIQVFQYLKEAGRP